MLPFKSVPLTRLFLPLALPNWSVNGVCYQHTKTCLLVQSADLNPFYCRGPSTPLLLNTAELAGRELAQARPPRGIHCSSAHLTCLLLTCSSPPSNTAVLAQPTHSPPLLQGTASASGAGLPAGRQSVPAAPQAPRATSVSVKTAAFSKKEDFLKGRSRRAKR